MYEVLLHPDAEKFYVNADKALAKKIARCLQQLEQTPRSHPNIKALKGDLAGTIEIDALNPAKFAIMQDRTDVCHPSH
jgi:mRNA interferase RelE/StbE